MLVNKNDDRSPHVVVHGNPRRIVMRMRIRTTLLYSRAHGRETR